MATEQPEQPEAPPAGTFPYPAGGSFSLPAPVMLDHIRLYWKTAVEPSDGAPVGSLAVSEALFNGGRALILDYGTWEITGYTIGDLKEDRIPADLWSLIATKTADYITPFLPQAMRRVLLLRG